MHWRLPFVLVVLISSVVIAQEETPATKGPPYKSIIYFFDASDAMKPQMLALRDQLKQSIQNLTPDRQFNLVPLRTGRLSPMSPALVTASREQVEKAHNWLDKLAAQGKPSLLGVVEHLKANDADLCYVLVTDDIPDVETVATWLKGEYKGKAKINVILLTADPKGPRVRLFQQLANQHGGVLKIIEKDKF